MFPQKVEQKVAGLCQRMLYLSHESILDGLIRDFNSRKEIFSAGRSEMFEDSGYTVDLTRLIFTFV